MKGCEGAWGGRVEDTKRGTGHCCRKICKEYIADQAWPAVEGKPNRSCEKVLPIYLYVIQ